MVGHTPRKQPVQPEWNRRHIQKSSLRAGAGGDQFLHQHSSVSRGMLPEEHSGTGQEGRKSTGGKAPGRLSTALGGGTMGS